MGAEPARPDPAMYGLKIMHFVGATIMLTRRRRGASGRPLIGQQSSDTLEESIVM